MFGDSFDIPDEDLESEDVLRTTVRGTLLSGFRTDVSTFKGACGFFFFLDVTVTTPRPLLPYRWGPGLRLLGRPPDRIGIVRSGASVPCHLSLAFLHIAKRCFHFLGLDS